MVSMVLMLFFASSIANVLAIYNAGGWTNYLIYSKSFYRSAGSVVSFSPFILEIYRWRPILMFYQLSASKRSRREAFKVKLNGVFSQMTINLMSKSWPLMVLCFDKKWAPLNLPLLATFDHWGLSYRCSHFSIFDYARMFGVCLRME